MGSACVTAKEGVKTKSQEVYLLSLIFADLSARAVGKSGIDKDQLVLFLQIYGLWAEEIANVFHQEYGQISFESFLNGIQCLAYVSLDEQKTRLFSFYDLKKQGFLDEQSLLQMIFSYPKEQIRSLVDDSNFREFVISSEQKQGLLKRQDEDAKTEVVHKSKSRRKLSACQQIIVNEDSVFLKNASINYLTRKFSKFLVVNYGNKEGRIELEGFKKLTYQHDTILKEYFKEFNTVLWKCEQKAQWTPSFHYHIKHVVGTSVKQKSTEQRAYVTALSNALLFFKNKTVKEELPYRIVCLKGLDVQHSEERTFVFSHKDNIYERMTLRFDSSEKGQSWEYMSKILKDYSNSTNRKKYVLREKLGSGNYSVVYKCLNQEANTLHAAKVIDKCKLKEEERDLIKRQIAIMRLLNHKNVIAVHDIFNQMNDVIIILEIAPSGDLKTHVSRHRRLTERQAAQVLAQMFDAMSYFKDLGLIHRDLKPENVIVKFNESQALTLLKIIDFGFAVYEAELSKISEAQKLVGTPNFLAPQIFLKEEYDYQVDMFSAGVILFYMVSGQLPFDHFLDEEVFNNIKDMKYDMVGINWFSVSQDCKSLIREMLQRDPARRISLEAARRNPWLLLNAT